MKKKIIIIPVLLTAAAGAWYCCGKEKSPATLELSGNVDIRSVNVSFRVGGRLAELTAAEGAPVQAGQLLGRLDAEPYELAREQAEANLAGARAAVERAESYAAVAQAEAALLQSGYRQEDIDHAQAQLDAQTALLQTEEKEYRRQEKLVQTNAVSQQSLDNAEKAYRSRTATVAAYRAELEKLTAGYRKEEIAKAHAQLRAAETAVQESEIQLQSAEIQLKQAELNLKDTELLSPGKGILMTRAVEPGSMISAGATVFTLSLREPIRVRAYIDEPYLGRITLGQKVRVRNDSGQEFTGTISFISPQAEFTPKTVETLDIRTTFVYRILVTVEAPCDTLNQGAPVRVLLNN